MFRSQFARGLAVAAAVALVGTACGNSGSDGAGSDSNSSGTTTPRAEGDRDTFIEIDGVPGVTDDEITYSVISLKDGNPLGTCILDCYVDGIEAYFDFRNSEGGIYGRDLSLGDVLDDNLANNQVRAREVIENDSSFGTFSATLLASGFSDLDAAGIPTYTWANTSESDGLESVFPSLGGSCLDCTGRTVPFAATLAEANKAAVLAYSASDSSRLCGVGQEKSFDKYQDDIGVEAVYVNTDLDFGLPNGLGPEVTAMKDAGVDFISTCIDLNGMKTLAQELDRQGMDDVTLFHPNTYDAGFVAEAGDLFEGDYIATQFRPFDADGGDSALDDFLASMDKNGSELTEIAMVGWINASLAFDGLLEAGPDFDQASVIAATNTMTDFSADGLLNPIDWTRQHDVPTEEDPVTHGYVLECFSGVQVVDGEFESVGEADNPWFCWSNEDLNWSDPTPTNF